MTVQQCPVCGARYNVERMAEGATFACRRCGGSVRVGEHVASHGGLSLGMAVAGCMLIATTFLQASPSLGRHSEWPWERYGPEDSMLARVTFLVWAFAGVWALLASLVPARRARAGVATVCAAVLAVLCTTPLAGFSVEAKWLVLPQLLAVVALAAGLRLAPYAGSAFVGRALAFAGGAALLAWSLVHFAPYGGRTGSELEVLVRKIVDVVRGDAAAGSSATLWNDLVPPALLLVAAAFGVLGGLGLSGRRVAWLALTFTTTAIVLPVFVLLGQQVEGLTLADLRNDLLKVFVDRGLALFALGCAAVADLARIEGVEA